MKDNASEGLETLSETDYIHRFRYARDWKGQNKGCHRCWQSKSNSTARNKLAPSKPSMTLSADQNRLPPTFGGIPKGAFQVPQLAVSSTTQKQYLPSQGPNMASSVRDDYYIRSSLPKLKLAEFSGSKFWKTSNGCECSTNRNCSFPPMKPYDGAALIKYTSIVSSCVNVLTQFKYMGDSNSEGVLGSATRKLTLDLKTKWLTHVKQLNLYQPGLAVFSECLSDIAEVQDELLLSSNPNADRAKSSHKEKAKGSTFITSTTNTASDNSKNKRECVLKDVKDPMLKCEKFKKMNAEERGQKAKELKLCFKCLSAAHQMKNFSGRLCDVNGCRKPHQRLLHRPYKNVEQKKNVENVDEVSNLSSMRSSGVLPVIPVTIGSESKTLKTFTLCDYGASLYFMDENRMKALNLTGQHLIVAGIHGTSDISSKQLRVKIRDQDGRVKEDIMVYSHPNVNAGN